ncbi:MAG TPA: hypothetical protein VGC97_05610 [Pyrinomonadaceae bacterium]|jgi:hypothetical protein
MQVKSLNDLAVRVASDPQFEAAVKADPVGTITNAAMSAQLPDTLIYRMVVGALGLTVLLTVIGAITLIAIGKGEIPASIIALGSAAVGALAGLLAPSPARQG